MEEHLQRSSPWNTVGGRVISLISRKGGVGKTTSAVNLGAALALSGHSVLIVGTDPQCGVCRTLGCLPEDLPTCLSDIFDNGSALTDLALPSTLPNLLYVSPKILSLREEESLLDLMDLRVDEFVREIDRARNLYDTIFIDCAPGLGPTTRAALLASDSYLVPVQTEELCRGSVEHLLDFVEAFRARAYPVPQTGYGTSSAEPLVLEGLFLTMSSKQTKISRHVATRMAEEYSDHLFEASIPRNTKLSEMALLGKPAVIFDRLSAGSRAYFNLADEIVERYCLSHEKQEQELVYKVENDEAQLLAAAANSPEPISMTDKPLVGLKQFLNEQEDTTQVTQPDPIAGTESTETESPEP